MTRLLCQIGILLAKYRGQRDANASLTVINQMQADGDRQVRGDAVGATFYLEPSAMPDVDIFVSFPSVPANSLLDLAPINDYLLVRGCRADTEYIVIGEWPVQFLPPSGDLEREAIDQARLKLTA